MKNPKISLQHDTGGDLSIVLLVALLVIFGTVMIFSASYYYSISSEGDAYYYLKRQLFWLGVGTAAMIFFANVDYHLWDKFWIIIYGAGLLLLIVVLVPGIGSSAGGAQRWIPLGPITIMPGEIAKITLIFYMSGFISRNPGFNHKFEGVIGIVLMTGIYAGLILMQPNMSTAFTVVFICAGMLLVSGTKWIHMGILAAAGGAAGVALIFSSEYRRHRLLSFLDPFEDALGDGYQVVQSLLALGTGGFKGLGLGNSVQKNLYLPQPQNDFILAIIGEELGFLGIMILIIVYVLLLWRGCKAAMNAKDYYGKLMASGITVMIGVQVVINIAVVTSSMPPTGIILPFVSYGGNALMLLMAMMGILVNITRQSEKDYRLGAK